MLEINNSPSVLSMLKVQCPTSIRFLYSYNYGIDLKWFHSIFLVSMPDEVDQLTKMQIERVRIRLQCPITWYQKAYVITWLVTWLVIRYLCAKFGAFTINPTILAPICWTIRVGLFKSWLTLTLG